MNHNHNLDTSSLVQIDAEQCTNNEQYANPQPSKPDSAIISEPPTVSYVPFIPLNIYQSKNKSVLYEPNSNDMDQHLTKHRKMDPNPIDPKLPQTHA